MYKLRIVKIIFLHFAYITVFTSFAQAQSSEIDLSKEIMKQLACYCGCRLPANSCEGNMTCNEAKELHAEVNQLLAEGKSKDAVLDALVAKYGETILAAPTTKGFNLLAWTLPFLAILMGAFVVYRVIRKLNEKSPQVSERTSKEQTTKDTKTDSYLEKKFEKELKDFGA